MTFTPIQDGELQTPESINSRLRELDSRISSVQTTLDSQVTAIRSDLTSEVSFVKLGIVAFKSFANGDTTPSVLSGTRFKTTNTSKTTITFLDDGTDGQAVWVVLNDSHTDVDFTDETKLVGNAGVAHSSKTGDSLRAIFDGTKWFCTIYESRSS